MSEEWSKKLNDLIEDLKKQKVCIIHHTDADGVSAASVFCRVFNNYILHHQKNEIKITEETISFFRKTGLKYAVIVDLNVDAEEKTFRQLEKLCEKVIVLDHHIMNVDLSSEKTMHLNPLKEGFKEAEKYPASKYAFDILGFKENDPVAWKVAVGLFGDKALRYWKGFWEKVSKIWNLSIEDLKKISLTFDFSKAVSWDLFNKVRDIYISSKSPEDYLSKAYQIEELEKVKRKYTALRKKALENAKLFNEFIVLFLEDCPELKSLLANEVSERYSDKTVVVLTRDKDNPALLRISLRRQDRKYSMKELTRFMQRNLESFEGGGHIPAAGGKFLEKEMGKFMECLKIFHKE